MTDVAIAACPFCGGRLQENNEAHGHFWTHPGRSGFKRSDCWMCDVVVDDRPDEIAAWNRRPASGDIAGALEQCAKWFQEYADSHTAQGKLDKARRNQDRADFARTALASLSGRGEVDSDGRRKGHSKLVYNKATRTIDKVDPHPPAAPDGWKLVPVEPTAAMVFAAPVLWGGLSPDHGSVGDEVNEIRKDLASIVKGEGA